MLLKLSKTWIFYRASKTFIAQEKAESSSTEAQISSKQIRQKILKELGCHSISSLISASKNYLANQINESAAQPVNSKTENPKSKEVDLTSVLSSYEKENTKMSESEMFGNSNNVSPKKSKKSAAEKTENTKMYESERNFGLLNKVSPEKSKNSAAVKTENSKIYRNISLFLSNKQGWLNW